MPEARGGVSSRYAETESELPNPVPRADAAGAPRGAAGFPARGSPGRTEPRVGWPKN